MGDDTLDILPDVRDGLTRRERIVLVCLNQLQRELGLEYRGKAHSAKAHSEESLSPNKLIKKNVPTMMLYGRVVEHVDMSQDELQEILSRWSGALSR